MDRGWRYRCPNGLGLTRGTRHGPLKHSPLIVVLGLAWPISHTMHGLATRHDVPTGTRPD